MGDLTAEYLNQGKALIRKDATYKLGPSGLALLSAIMIPTKDVAKMDRNANKLRLETRKNLQTALKAAGLFSGTIDGRMGDNTKEALRAYAKANRK